MYHPSTLLSPADVFVHPGCVLNRKDETYQYVSDLYWIPAIIVFSWKRSYVYAWKLWKNSRFANCSTLVFNYKVF